MGLEKLSATLVEELAGLETEGRAKASERVIVGYVPPAAGRGPRSGAAATLRVIPSC